MASSEDDLPFVAFPACRSGGAPLGAHRALGRPSRGAMRVGDGQAVLAAIDASWRGRWSAELGGNGAAAGAARAALRRVVGEAAMSPAADVGQHPALTDIAAIQGWYFVRGAAGNQQCSFVDAQ